MAALGHCTHRPGENLCSALRDNPAADTAIRTAVTNSLDLLRAHAAALSREDNERASSSGALNHADEVWISWRTRAIEIDDIPKDYRRLS